MPPADCRDSERNIDMNKEHNYLIWIARISVSLVFLFNIQSALIFLIRPELFMGAYELSGEVGQATIRGIGILFLMWNVTYPWVIKNPIKHIIIYHIVLLQSLIGIIGESWIFFTIRDSTPVLAESIQRFILFDGIGFIIMLIPFILILFRSNYLHIKDK